MNTKQKLLQAYKESLNPKSKWFEQDLNDYKRKVSLMSETEAQKRLNNLLGLNSKQFDKQCKREVLLMEKCGMFDVKSMNAKNALS